jgi:hypothetical protein
MSPRGTDGGVSRNFGRPAFVVAAVRSPFRHTTSPLARRPGAVPGPSPPIRCLIRDRIERCRLRWRYSRGNLGSPSVHREPPIRGERGRPSRPFRRHRRAVPRRDAGRSRNRAPTRIRVRRVHRPRRRRRGDPQVRRTAVPGTDAGGERGSRPGRSAATAPWQFRSPARGPGRRAARSTPRGLRTTPGRPARQRSPTRPGRTRSQRQLRSARAAPATPREEGRAAGAPAPRPDQGTHGRPHLRRRRSRRREHTGHRRYRDEP